MIFGAAVVLALAGCDGSGPEVAAWITGHTRIAGTDSMLAGVPVHVGDQTVFSGPDGAFRIEGLGEGTHLVTASLPGFEPYAQEVTLRPGRHRLDPALVRFRSTPPPPPPPRTGTVEGKVSNRSGAPLAGATVTIAGRVAITGTDGAYRLESVPVGEAWGTFYMPNFETVSVPAVVDTLASTLDVELAVIPYNGVVQVDPEPMYSAPGVVDRALVRWAAAYVPSAAYPKLRVFRSVDGGAYQAMDTFEGAATAGPWADAPGLPAEALRFALQVIDCEGGQSRLYESEPMATYDLGLVRIAAGTFVMGSDTAPSALERPAHAVTLTRAFYLARAETEARAFYRVMGSVTGGSGHGPVQGEGTWRPVEFLNLLSDAEGLERCYDVSNHPVEGFQDCTGYRLPTEAEWEYAARAGSTTSYPWGDDTANIAAHAWTMGIGTTRAHPVMLLSANAWGLYDMIGNVAELVQDQLAPYGPGAVVDPLVYDRSADEPFNWIVRGGSFWEFPGWGQFTSTYRSAEYPGAFVGFRVARTIPPGG